MMNLKSHFQSPLYRYVQMPEALADGLHPYHGLGIGRFWRVIWYSHSIKSGEDVAQFDRARIVSEVARIGSRNFGSTCGNNCMLGNTLESWDE